LAVTPSRGLGIGYIASLAGALLFGLNGVVIKMLMEGTALSGSQITQFRVTGTAIIMGAVMLVINRRALILKRAQVVPIVILGVVVASLQATYAIAVNMMPVGIALLLEYTAVLFVALIAFFWFKEFVKARIWVSIALVLVGLAVVAEVWNTTLDPIGVLWAMGASISLTAYFRPRRAPNRLNASDGRRLLDNARRERVLGDVQRMVGRLIPPSLLA
jgi:drug/metabolite transporter (DMT)-like permease